MLIAISLAVGTVFALLGKSMGALQCGGVAPYQCLPGVDALGIGFDAVFGAQALGVGRQVINFSFTDPSKTYLDPFGNTTIYSYPDQAYVMQSTSQFLGHNVYRSVTDYVHDQATDARVDAGIGGFFSASVETKSASQTMMDNLHIIAESKAQVGIYTVTLDPALLLGPASKFAQYVNLLPDTYDDQAYAQFIQDWGTHYVSAATFGGVAKMHTTISHSYYSYHSDSAIQVNLKVMWGLFGGGGGGGSSSHTTDADWQASASSYTTTSGGDPSIRSFNSSDEWSRWAQSVLLGSPIVTSYTLEDISAIVPNGTRRENVQKAVLSYVALHNSSFPPASPTNYTMDYCDCKSAGDTHSNCQLVGTGYFLTYVETDWHGGHDPHYVCCRPCFTTKTKNAPVDDSTPHDNLSFFPIKSRSLFVKFSLRCHNFKVLERVAFRKIQQRCQNVSVSWCLTIS